ncbi:MAG: putative low-complexity protein [Propionibacteriaceae bacterium]|nr:putative low-complexity protein [Propionibacteriaceae bacterium]
MWVFAQHRPGAVESPPGRVHLEATGQTMPAGGSTGLKRMGMPCRFGTVRAPISGNPAQQNVHGTTPPATADLHGADLHEATLRHATLTEINLAEADLTEADFTRANLGGASLRNATASHANFEEADLRDADLTGANLRGARLTGAKLCQDQRTVAASAGADLDDAKSEDTNSRVT